MDSEEYALISPKWLHYIRFILVFSLSLSMDSKEYDLGFQK